MDSCLVLFYSDHLDHIFERRFPDLVSGLAVAKEVLRSQPDGIFNAFVLADGKLRANLYRTAGGVIIDIGAEPWALSRREVDRVRVEKGKVKGLPKYVEE